MISWTELTHKLNNNKLLLGIAMISMNIGSRYLLQDITREHESLMMTTVFKNLVVFFIFFMATRDFVFSVVLAAMFAITMRWFLNKNSVFNLIPRKILLQSPVSSSTIPPKPSDKDYEQAKAIIKIYEESTDIEQLPSASIRANTSLVGSYFDNVSKMSILFKK